MRPDGRIPFLNDKIVMDKEIHIYNYHEAKPSNDGSHGYINKGSLIIFLVGLLSPILGHFAFKDCFGGSEPQKAEVVEQPKKAEPVAVQKPMPVHPAEPVYNTTPSGAVETTVTTSVVSSPYTWNYVVQDVVTKDSIHVSLYLKITSQIIEGQEKVLLQNYGGNWFYTVFAPKYSSHLHEGIKSYMYKQVALFPHHEYMELCFTDIANKQVRKLSEEFVLPVEIKKVAIVEVK